MRSLPTLLDLWGDGMCAWRLWQWLATTFKSTYALKIIFSFSFLVQGVPSLIAKSKTEIGNDVAIFSVKRDRYSSLLFYNLEIYISACCRLVLFIYAFSEDDGNIKNLLKNPLS